MAADSIANSIYVFNGLEALFASSVNWIITITYGFGNDRASTIGLLFALVLIVIMRKVIALRKAYESGNMVRGIDAFVVHIGWTSFLIILLMWPMSGVKVRYIHDPTIDLFNGGDTASSYTKAIAALSSLSQKNKKIFDPIQQNTYTLPLVYVLGWNIGSWVVYYPFKDIAHSYFTTDLIPSLLTTDLVSASLNSDEMNKLIARAEKEADSLDSRAVVAANLIKKRLEEEFLKLNSSPVEFADWLSKELPTITCVDEGGKKQGLFQKKGTLLREPTTATKHPTLKGIMFRNLNDTNATCLGFGVQVSGSPIPLFDFRENLSMSDASPYTIKSYRQLNSARTANRALIFAAAKNGDISSITVVPNIDYFTNMAKAFRGMRPRWDTAVEDFRVRGNDSLEKNVFSADGVGYQFAYEYMDALYWGVKQAGYKTTNRIDHLTSKIVKFKPSYIDSLATFLGSVDALPNPSDSSSVTSFKSELVSYDQNLNDFAFELEGQKKRLKSAYANMTTAGTGGSKGGAFAALSAVFNPVGWVIALLNAVVFFMLLALFFAKIIKQTVEALSVVLMPLQIGMSADESAARTVFSKILASRLADLAFIFGSLVSFMVGKLVIDLLTSDSSTWIMNALIGTGSEVVVPLVSGSIQIMLITGAYVIFTRIQWSSATLPQSFGAADGGGGGGGGGPSRGAAAEAMERNVASAATSPGAQASGVGHLAKAADSAAGAVTGGAKGAWDAFKSSAGGGGDKGSGGGAGKVVGGGAKALATGGASVVGDLAKEAGKKTLDAATGGKSPQSSKGGGIGKMVTGGGSDKGAGGGDKSPQSGSRKRGKGGGADGAAGGDKGSGGKGGGILAGMVKGAVEGSKSGLSGQVGAGSIKALTNMAGQKKPLKALMDSYKNFAMESVGAGGPPASEESKNRKNSGTEE